MKSGFCMATAGFALAVGGTCTYAWAEAGTSTRSPVANQRMSLLNSTIENCTGREGAGIHATGGTVDDCVFRDNTCTYIDGNYGSSTTFRRCLFFGNATVYWGGGCPRSCTNSWYRVLKSRAPGGAESRCWANSPRHTLSATSAPASR